MLPKKVSNILDYLQENKSIPLISSHNPKRLGQTLTSRPHRRACGFASPLPAASAAVDGEGNPGASAPVSSLG